MSEVFPDLGPMLYEFYSRITIFFVLSIFAIINMSYLNSEYEAGVISDSDIQTLDTAFEIIGVLLVVYLTLPVLKYGYDKRHAIGGKLLLGWSMLLQAAGIVTVFV